MPAAQRGASLLLTARGSRGITLSSMRSTSVHPSSLLSSPAPVFFGAASDSYYEHSNNGFTASSSRHPAVASTSSASSYAATTSSHPNSPHMHAGYSGRHIYMSPSHRANQTGWNSLPSSPTMYTSPLPSNSHAAATSASGSASARRHQARIARRFSPIRMSSPVLAPATTSGTTNGISVNVKSTPGSPMSISSPLSTSPPIFGAPFEHPAHGQELMELGLTATVATTEPSRRVGPIGMASPPSLLRMAAKTSTSPLAGARLFSTSTAELKDHSTVKHEMTEEQDQQSKPSASDDPYPLPFDPLLDPSQRGPQSDSPAPVTVPHARLNAGDENAAPSNMSTTDQNEGLDMTDMPLRVPGRDDEDRQTKIARLIYQTRKRGTLETDLILSTFAQEELEKMEMAEVDEFDRLLDEPDWDIFYWATERKAPPARWSESFNTEGRLGWRLLRHTRNEGKQVRRMPPTPATAQPQRAS